MIYYLGVDILKAGNISKEPEKTVQHDSELSFEENMRRCSEAIHSGKADRFKHRYHFLAETEDGDGISLCDDELRLYLKHRNSIQHPIQASYLIDSTEPTKKVRRSTIILWALSILLVCVSALALFFAFRSSSLESSLSKTMSDLEQSISKSQTISNDRDQLRDTVSQYSDEINFWRSNVVIVTEFGEKYHTYGCQYIKNNDILWFMNVGVARLRGYEACSVCSPVISPY